MVAVVNNIAVGRDTQAWVVPETAFGVLATPTASNSVLISAGGTFTQAANLIEDAQKRQSRSRYAQILGKFAAADWSFSTYMKPVLPAALPQTNDYLLEGLFGTRTYSSIPNGTLILQNQVGSFLPGELLSSTLTGSTAAGTIGTIAGGTINLSVVTSAFVAGDILLGATSGATAVVYSVIAGTNVSYTPAQATVNSYSIYANVGGHTTLMLRGATVNQGVFTVNGVDISTAAWTGQGIELLWTGTSQIGVVVAAASTVVTVADGTLYSVGSRIQIQSASKVAVDDNAGLGYIVSAVNNNILTISTAGGFVIGGGVADFVAPWNPATLDTGVLVHGRTGAVTLNNTVFPVTDSTITVANGLQYVVDEKDGADFASVVTTPTPRTVDGSVKMYFRPGDTRFFAQGKASTQLPVQINVGTISGQRFSIYLPNAVFSIPTLDSGNLIAMSMSLRAEASDPAVDGEIVLISD